MPLKHSVLANEPGEGAPVRLHLADVRFLSLFRVCRPVIRHLHAPGHLVLRDDEILIEPSEGPRIELLVEVCISMLEVELFISEQACVEF